MSDNETLRLPCACGCGVELEIWHTLFQNGVQTTIAIGHDTVRLTPEQVQQAILKLHDAVPKGARTWRL